MSINLYALLGLTLVATLVLLMPLLRYLFVGWFAKRADIMDGLNAASRVLYFTMFCKSTPTPTEAEAVERMEFLYTRWYGRWLFLSPGALLVIVGTVAIYLALGSAFLAQGLVDKQFIVADVGLTGISAIAGAYMWVVNDFISRARRLDFSPSDVHWGVLRIAISVPMGYSFSKLAPELGPFVAFAAGAFPLSSLTKILRRTASSKLGYDDAATPGSDEVVKLQGVNTAIAERLANEDITTITQVAYCDPIRLTMRSNLTFNVVTDLMNQALAWEYLGADLDKIRPLGLRGAVEIKHLLDALNGPRAAAETKLAAQALPEIAKALGQAEATVLTAFDEIAKDPFTDYLNGIWE